MQAQTTVFPVQTQVVGQTRVVPVQTFTTTQQRNVSSGAVELMVILGGIEVCFRGICTVSYTYKLC